LRELENFINGAFVAPADARASGSEPRDRRDDRAAPLSGGVDIDAAVGAARRAFEGWSQTTPAERAEALLGLATRSRSTATSSPAMTR